MTDVQQSSAILVNILRVLERIEEKLEKQDRRLEHLENDTLPSNGSTEPQVFARSPATLENVANGGERPEYVLQQREYDGPASTYTLSKENRFVDISSNKNPGGIRVRYSKWSINQRNWDGDEGFVKLLNKKVGDYWQIPYDRRLSLKIFKSTMDDPEDYWGSQIAMYNGAKSTVLNRLDLLHRFDATLRTEQGNDFFIVDYDSTNNTRIYRVGEIAIGSELMVNPRQLDNAPWSRLIVYQGMTTGESIKPDKKHFNQALPEPIPYFARGDTSTGLWTHLFFHLRLKRRDTTMNPYWDPSAGFHTTFYEIRKSEHLHINELWKQGPLYDHPLGWYFRKSAYTLYAPPNSKKPADEPTSSESLSRHWTLLLLAPDYFFNENNTSFPMKALPPGRAQALGHCLGRLTQQGAEMNLIGQGLERISERWASFQSFFEFILDGGDSLMNPSEHDTLLFDDGAFSRSRRYFWAIDCLSEFEACVSDNITQWELYKEARILPSLNLNGFLELDVVQLRNADRQYQVLQNQREYFRRKLASTKALRDALFNASAVIESRASTRLGENVKLLTFVSIFFLPLAFCTSLWSINDKFSSTSLIIVILVVALLTYLTMFNVNSLVHNLSRLYEAQKRPVVRAMKADRAVAWRRRGTCFDAFRPKHENPKPSEWYVTLYALLNPAVMLGLSGRVGTESEGESDGMVERRGWWRRVLGMGRIFERKKMRPTESTLDDQPWVL